MAHFAPTLRFQLLLLNKLFQCCPKLNVIRPVDCTQIASVQCKHNHQLVACITRQELQQI